MAVQVIEIDAEDGDQRLDRWLRRRFPGLRQGQIEKLLRTGQIRVDGGRAKSATRLAPGQSVRVPPLPDADAAPAPVSPAEPSSRDAALIRSLVLFEDEHMVVINKPPGLPSQGGSGQTRHIDGMLDALARNRRPMLVHRLDKDTSGVMAIARTVPAARALSEALRTKAARKLYWAAVNGAPKPRNGTIRYALRKAPGRGGEKMLCVHPDQAAGEEARRAVTDYATLESLGGRAAWMALRPVTGRTHQLRAHMAEIGCPIVGDGKYGTNAIGNEGAGWGAQMGGEISRKLHLHARRLRMPHPSGRGLVDVTAPLPDHMARSWAVFGWQEAQGDDLLPEGWDT